MNDVFTGGQQRALLAVTVSLSAFSLVGTSLIVLSYLKFVKLRTFSFSLVFYMSIADMGALISYMFGSPKGGAFCTIQGFVQQLFELSSFAWSTIIAYTLYRAVVKLQDSKPLLPYYYLFGYGIPLLCAFIPLATSSYVNTGAWCWISNEQTIGQVLRWLLFYGPLWGCISFNAYISFITTKKMRDMFSTREKDMPDKYKALIKRLSLYPLILVVCWLWATVNRFQNAVSPGNEIFWMYLLMTLFRSLQGLLNCIAYGLQPGVRRCWIEWLSNRPRTGWIVDSLRPQDNLQEEMEEEEEGYDGGDGAGGVFEAKEELDDENTML